MPFHDGASRSDRVRSQDPEDAARALYGSQAEASIRQQRLPITLQANNTLRQTVSGEPSV